MGDLDVELTVAINSMTYEEYKQFLEESLKTRDERLNQAYWPLLILGCMGYFFYFTYMKFFWTPPY